MNILFFLTPKSEVAHIEDDISLEDALRQMQRFQYTAVPMIDRQGHYVGTMTEGDVLWYLRCHKDRAAKSLDNIPVLAVDRRMDNHPVSIDADIEDLVSKAMNQNFVPVIDDNEIFIGIVKRKDIIEYCYRKLQQIDSK